MNGKLHQHGALVFLPHNTGGFSVEGCPNGVELARRIVACLNSFDGMSTGEIEQRSAWVDQLHD